MEQVWDPLRRKNVALTPEERVRQWFIGVLAEEMKVPKVMMMSEVGMNFGEEIGAIGGTKIKAYRADIVVYDRDLRPLMVVECKRPEVELTQAVLEQAMRYNMVLGVRWLVITNGARTYICRRDAEGFRFVAEAPVYEVMLGDSGPSPE